MTYQTTFSTDRVHRYTLWREWVSVFTNEDDFHFVNFICLNPSTATETKDDPTMRKCIKFAKAWGYDAMCVTNIFAFRSTDPEGMKAAADPIGPDNDYFLENVASDADLVVAAWSQHATFMGRGRDVQKMLASLMKPIHYLRMGTGKDPQPWHPLYLPDSTKPQLWVTI
jgi:hypothetical protein